MYLRNISNCESKLCNLEGKVVSALVDEAREFIYNGFVSGIAPNHVGLDGDGNIVIFFTDFKKVFMKRDYRWDDVNGV